MLDACGRVPDRHDRVADVLVDRAAGGLDGIGHHREVVAEALRQHVGRELLGERREAFDVREHQRQVDHLAAELGLLVRLVETSHEVNRYEFAHRPDDGLRALEAVHHLVDVLDEAVVADRLEVEDAHAHGGTGDAREAAPQRDDRGGADREEHADGDREGAHELPLEGLQVGGVA